MKIKIRSLGFPKRTGYVIQPTDRSDSGTAYPANKTSGLAISEIYIRDKTGVIDGERLGVERNVWIPYSAVAGGVRLQRADILIITFSEKLTPSGSIQNVDKYFEIVDIQDKIDSYIEDHYEININERNP